MHRGSRLENSRGAARAAADPSGTTVARCCLRMTPRKQFAATGAAEEARRLQWTVLARRYALGGVIGEGSASTVLEGTDTRTGRSIAAKVLHARAGAERGRARREGLGALVSHPNVCTVLEALEGPFLSGVIVERVVGDLLSHRIATDGPLSIDEAVDVFTQLLGALDAVHRVGLVHRDVKPSNIFLVATSGCRPFVKLIDFGCALHQRHEYPGHAVVGSPAYMAPEQARRERAIDARADLYAVGVSLFEALGGRASSTTFDQFLTALPSALGVLLRRATAEKRRERYQSAQEMQAALAQVRAVEVEAAGPGPQWEYPTRVSSAPPPAVSPPPRSPISETMLIGQPTSPAARDAREEAAAGPRAAMTTLILHER